MPKSSLALSDAQQYFLQIMINKKVIDQMNFKKIFNGVLQKLKLESECDDSNFKDYYTNFLREINLVIRVFNMEIKTAHCETSAYTYFCLIRQCDTGSIGTLSALYTSPELKVFRKILELIVESDDGCVEYGTAVDEIIEHFETIAHEASTQNQISKVPGTSEIRRIVERFIQDYWFTEVVTRPNMITLHGRAAVELAPYIKSLYKDDDVLNYCEICKSLVLSGLNCEHCSHKIHRFCARNMLKKSKDCPGCRTAFTSDQIQEFNQFIEKAREAIAKNQS